MQIRTAVYGNFGGVDFSVDASLVDKKRSPWAPNMIGDIGGMPEKRLGWRLLHMVEAPVNGIFTASFEGVQQIIVHGGTKLYRLLPESGAPEQLLANLHSGISQAVVLVGKLWILTGGQYLCYDGQTAKAAGVDAYIPTTIIARPPGGGGTTFEAINLITPWRKNEFIPDGTTKIYQLDSTGLDSAKVQCTIRGEAKTEGTDFSVNRSTGQVTFNTAPLRPTVGQEGEVIITFAKTVAGYADKVNRCRVLSTYGKGSPDRAVFAGNPEFPNQDWIGGYNDPSYVPDLGYAVVGGTGSAIVGYASIGEYQAIFKESSFQDATVFLRSALIDAEGEVTFPIRQGVSGVGAVARGCIGHINDEPVFLAPGGVYALTSNMITAERTVQNRSYYLDQRLTNEPDLAGAQAVNWKGYLLIGINGRCYILDGRRRSYIGRSNSEFVYEGYHWEQVPARCWCNVREGVKEELYFGTEDGRLCRFNTDIKRMHRYSDWVGYDAEGEPIYAPIVASWSTLADDDGDATRLKTMIKKGAAVTIKPYVRSSAYVLFRTDRDAVEKEARFDTMDIFDWEDIDFARFSFNANDGPQEIMFRSKVKKYKRLQIIIANRGEHEGFGILGITKHYVTGNFAKR